jgi:hypothetical protein
VAEDGKPQAISAFDEHKREASASLDFPALPPNVYTNIQRLRSADAVNVLLIDLLNTQPCFQKGVCTQANKYLKTVPPGTRLAPCDARFQRGAQDRHARSVSVLGTSLGTNGHPGVRPIKLRICSECNPYLPALPDEIHAQRRREWN